MFRFLFEFIKKKSFLSFDKILYKIAIIFVTLFWYSTSGYLYFELPHKPDLSWLDAMWWTLVTMTTVGYGDFFPETPGGRFFVGIPAMVFGIGFLGFIISEVASRLIESNSRRIRGMMQVKSKNHIIIINFSAIDSILTILQELQSDAKTRNKEICLIDETLDEVPKELVDKGIQFVKGDPTNENTLNQANIQKASHAIILSKDPGNPHSDDQNLSNTLVIEKLNPDIFSIAEVLNPQKIHQIELAGCDSVVCVSELTSNLIIQELQDPGVMKIIEELTSNRYGQQLYCVPIKNMREWIYKELALWGVENSYSLIGIFRHGGAMLNCSSDEKITADDKAILIGSKRINAIVTC